MKKAHCKLYSQSTGCRRRKSHFVQCLSAHARKPYFTGPSRPYMIFDNIVKLKLLTMNRSNQVNSYFRKHYHSETNTTGSGKCNEPYIIHLSRRNVAWKPQNVSSYRKVSASAFWLPTWRFQPLNRELKRFKYLKLYVERHQILFYTAKLI